MATAAKTEFRSEKIKPQIGTRILNSKEELLSGDFDQDDRLEKRGPPSTEALLKNP